MRAESEWSSPGSSLKFSIFFKWTFSKKLGSEFFGYRWTVLKIKFLDPKGFLIFEFSKNKIEMIKNFWDPLFILWQLSVFKRNYFSMIFIFLMKCHHERSQVEGQAEIGWSSGKWTKFWWKVNKHDQAKSKRIGVKLISGSQTVIFWPKWLFHTDW